VKAQIHAGVAVWATAGHREDGWREVRGPTRQGRSPSPAVMSSTHSRSCNRAGREKIQTLMCRPTAEPDKDVLRFRWC